MSGCKAARAGRSEHVELEPGASLFSLLRTSSAVLQPSVEPIAQTLTLLHARRLASPHPSPPSSSPSPPSHRPSSLTSTSPLSLNTPRTSRKGKERPSRGGQIAKRGARSRQGPTEEGRTRTRRTTRATTTDVGDGVGHRARRGGDDRAMWHEEGGGGGRARGGNAGGSLTTCDAAREGGEKRRGGEIDGGTK